jgi:hypothetical protein
VLFRIGNVSREGAKREIRNVSHEPARNDSRSDAGGAHEGTIGGFCFWFGKIVSGWYLLS